MLVSSVVGLWVRAKVRHTIRDNQRNEEELLNRLSLFTAKNQKGHYLTNVSSKGFYETQVGKRSLSLRISEDWVTFGIGKGSSHR